MSAAGGEGQPIDIYAEDKAKREAIDWARVHIRGDRSAPIALGDSVTRNVDGRGFSVRPWRLDPRPYA